MGMPVRLTILFVLVACSLGSATNTPAIPPPGAPDCAVFPANNYWHADVRDLPVHRRSEDWLAAMDAGSTNLHPNFGPSGDPLPYGIPYDVVDASHDKVSLDFT
jgi:hypothetical protein